MEKNLELIPIATGLSNQRISELTNSESMLSKLHILDADMDLDRDVPLSDGGTC